VAPTSAPATAVTTAPTVCESDLDFRVNAKKERSCNWVIAKDSRRKKFCKNKNVNSACPVACGICCADDPVYEFKTNAEMNAKCAWIGMNYVKRKKYCDQNKNKSACPLTCDNCQDPVVRD